MNHKVNPSPRSEAQPGETMVCSCTPGFILTYVNDACAADFGFPRSALLGMDFRTLIPEPTRRVVEDGFRTITPSSPVWINRNHVARPDGRILDQEWTNIGVFDEEGKPIEFHGVGRDITTQYEVEEELRLRQRLLQEAVASSSLGIWESGMVPDRIQWDELYARTLGYTLEEFPPSYENWKRVTYPGDAERVEKAFADYVANPELGFEVKNRLRHADGSWRWILTTGRVVETDQEGSPLRAVGTHRDITESETAVLALHHREQQLSIMMENLPDGILVLAGNRIVYENPSLRRLLGYESEDLLGKSPLDFMHRDAHEMIRDRIRRSNSGEDLEPARFHVLPRNGDPIPVEANSGRITYDGESAVLAMFHDLRPQEEANRKILEYQNRLQSLASEVSLAEERERRRIAAGLHDHTVQNLALLKIHLGQVLEDLVPEEEQTDLTGLRELLDETIRGTRSLMFELSPPVLYELGFVPALEWLCEHMDEQFEYVVTLDKQHWSRTLPQDLAVVLFQAVRELLTNVGKHAVATSTTLRLQSEGDRVCITVQDDGQGFDPGSVGHASDMNGFGLFLLKERIGLLGGDLVITSAPGQGCRAELKVECQS